MKVTHRKYDKFDYVELLAMLLGGVVGTIYFWGSIMGYILLASLLLISYTVWFVFFTKDKIVISEKNITVRRLFKKGVYLYEDYIIFRVDKYNGREYLTGVREDFKRDFIYYLRLVDTNHSDIVDYLNRQLPIDTSAKIIKYGEYLNDKKTRGEENKVETRNKLIFSIIVTLAIGFIPTILIAIIDINYKDSHNFEYSLKLPTLIYIAVLMFAGVFLGISFATTKKFVDDKGNKSDEEFIELKKKYRIAGFVLYFVAVVIIAYTYRVY